MSVWGAICVYLQHIRRTNSKDMTDNSRAIARKEAISAKNNRHVKWLTLKMNTVCPITGDKLWTTREELKEAQFFLRRAWAHTLLHIMKEEVDVKWSKMHEFSGRTRQSWINVTNGMWLNEKERSNPADHGNYRPVTNGFIKTVSETLEGHHFRLYTQAFVECWMLGLEVDWNNGHQQKFTRDRLGFKTLTNGWGPFGLEQTKFSDRAMEDMSSPTLFAIKDCGASDDPLLMDTFPLLEVDDETEGQVRVWEYILDCEDAVFHLKDAKTGEPDPRAVNAHSMWFQMSEHSPLTEENRMVDLKRFQSDANEYTVNQVRDMIELNLVDPMQGNQMIQDIERQMRVEEEINKVEEIEDEIAEFGEDLDQFDEDLKQTEQTLQKSLDLTPVPTEPQILKKADLSVETIEVKSQDKDMTEMGFLPTVHLPFEVHPAFLDEKMSGEVEFKVTVKYRNGVKVGHAIECI